MGPITDQPAYAVMRDDTFLCATALPRPATTASPPRRRSSTTFAYPATSAAASAEIRRLRALPGSGAGEARRERRDVQRALQERPDSATAIRAHDVRGYGSVARWAQTPTDQERRS